MHLIKTPWLAVAMRPPEGDTSVVLPSKYFIAMDKTT